MPTYRITQWELQRLDDGTRCHYKFEMDDDFGAPIEGTFMLGMDPSEMGPQDLVREITTHMASQKPGIPEGARFEMNIPAAPFAPGPRSAAGSMEVSG